MMIKRLTKTALINRIIRSRSELERLLGTLTPAQMTGIRSPDGWTVKDHLTHLTAWEAGMVAMLRKETRFEAMGLDPAFVENSNEEQINQRIFEKNRERALDDVLADFHEVHRKTMEALDELSEDELYHTYSYFQPDDPGEDRGIPIIEWVKGNTYNHFESHTEWIRKLVQPET